MEWNGMERNGTERNGTNDWINESMSQWMNAWMKEWRNEYLKNKYGKDGQIYKQIDTYIINHT